MSDKPGKQPQDHKPAAQLEVETPEWVTIHSTSLDRDFKIPGDLDELDGEFLRYAADQDSYRMIEIVLSADQFSELRKAKPKIRDYKELGDQIATTYGFDNAGE